MSKKIIILIIVVLVLIGGFLVYKFNQGGNNSNPEYKNPFGMVTVNLAATTKSSMLDSLTYPIGELKNCGNRAECKTYCDEVAHMSACLDYAEKKSLLNPVEISQSRAAVSQMSSLLKLVGQKGPGGCIIGQGNGCEQYCSVPEHLTECLNYSVSKGAMNQEEADVWSGKLPSPDQPLGHWPPALRAKLESCAKPKLGAQHFQDLTSGRVAPTAADDAIMENCFNSAELSTPN